MIERAELIDRHCSRVPIPASDGLSRNSDLLARVDWKLEDGDTFTAHAGVPEAKKESIVHRSTTTESSMILHDRSGALVTTLAATEHLPAHAINDARLGFHVEHKQVIHTCRLRSRLAQQCRYLTTMNRRHGLPGGTSSARASPLSSGVLENQFDALNTEEQ